VDEPKSRDDIVSVSTHSMDALSEPRFIIKIGDRYFLTLGTWEYEREKAATPAQKEGCDRIIDLYNRRFNNGPHGEAVRVPGEIKLLMMGTAIHPPGSPS
jgi:hypothetical protein